MLLFNQHLLDSLHYMTTVFKITSLSDSAHNDTLTYICANDNNKSEENKIESCSIVATDLIKEISLTITH